MTPRFLLAKYAPSLSRMEPRNIGVFLWANGKVLARFLEPDDALFVANKANYLDWVALWKELIAGGSIAPIRGAAIKTADPACLEALLTHQQDQYILLDAGELLQKITQNEHSSAIDYLFDELVANKSDAQEPLANGLKRQCERLISQAGLDQRTDFHSRYSIACTVFGVGRHFKCSYAIANGHLEAILQRVVLTSPRSVDSAALMLHFATESGVVSKEKMAVLVADSDQSKVREAVTLLETVARVVDVADVASAKKVFEELAR